MPNGKPGDHPITDILVHRIRTFSRSIDNLIIEIDNLGGRCELEKIDWFSNINIKNLKRQLLEIRDRLKCKVQ